MPEACVSLWSTDACEWSIGGIWSSSDVVLRGVFLGLALMLAYTVFFAVRFSRRYYLARRRVRTFNPDDLPNFTRANPNLLADLSPGLGMLKGIASAAPFLGLAGTCYGFFAGFTVMPGSRASALGYVVWIIAHMPVPTIVGIVVAIPATFSYNLIRARIEALRGLRLPLQNPDTNDLGSFHFAQTLPLKKQFVSPPHYALVAVPALACAIMGYMGSRLHPIPVGLRVALPSIRCDNALGQRVPSRLIVLRVINTGEVFINFEPVAWKDLSTRLSDIYRSRQDREIYVYAEEEVPFQALADAIDIVRNTQGAGPHTLGIKVTLLTHAGSPECAPMPVRSIPAIHR